MAGKPDLFTSTIDLDEADYAFNPRSSKAFCLGRLDQSNGVAISENPFTLDTERENYYAWRAGWSSSISGTPASETSCAV